MNKDNKPFPGWEDPNLPPVWHPDDPVEFWEKWTGSYVQRRCWYHAGLICNDFNEAFYRHQQGQRDVLACSEGIIKPDTEDNPDQYDLKL